MQLFCLYAHPGLVARDAANDSVQEACLNSLGNCSHNMSPAVLTIYVHN